PPTSSAPGSSSDHKFSHQMRPSAIRNAPSAIDGCLLRFIISLLVLVVQRELGGLEGKALQIPSSVGVRGALPPLAPPPNRVFRGPEAPNPHSEVKSRCSVSYPPPHRADVYVCGSDAGAQPNVALSSVRRADDLIPSSNKEL